MEPRSPSGKGKWDRAIKTDGVTGGWGWPHREHAEGEQRRKSAGRGDFVGKFPVGLISREDAGI